MAPTLYPSVRTRRRALARSRSGSPCRSTAGPNSVRKTRPKDIAAQQGKAAPRRGSFAARASRGCWRSAARRYSGARVRSRRLNAVRAGIRARRSRRVPRRALHKICFVADIGPRLPPHHPSSGGVNSSALALLNGVSSACGRCRPGAGRQRGGQFRPGPDDVDIFRPVAQVGALRCRKPLRTCSRCCAWSNFAPRSDPTAGIRYKLRCLRRRATAHPRPAIRSASATAGRR